MRRRRMELVRGAWGILLLVAPGTVLGRLPARSSDTRALAVARVLGARQVAQAGLSGLDPSPEVLAMGVWVDVAHAATAAGLGLADRPRASAGLVDALVAGTWAAIGYHDLVHGRATPAAHERRRDALARLVLGVAPGGKALLARARTDRRSEHR